MIFHMQGADLPCELPFGADGFCCASQALPLRNRQVIFLGAQASDAPREWKELVGIYLDEDSKHVFVLFERDRKLFWRMSRA